VEISKVHNSIIKQKGHIPGLDGVRAIAVILVLFCHSVIFDQFSDLHYIGVGAGYTGVTVFFVLSGYLITTLLLREEEQTGRISLRLFYIRRALRLFPALWAYLLVLALIKLIRGLPNDPWHSFVTSLFYVRNLVGRGHATGHLWTLSIEEQFYLLWPLALVSLAILVLPRRNVARLLLALVAIGGITAWRMYAAGKGLASIGTLYIRTDFRFDSPLFGCALALALSVAPMKIKWVNSTGLRCAVLALMGVGGLALWVAFRLDDHVYPGADTTVVCLLSVVLVLSQIGVQGRISNLLAWGPLVMIGQISYGVYLWQGLFLGPLDEGVAITRVFPVGLILSFAFALVSYWFLEKPLLRLKDRKFHKQVETAQRHMAGDRSGSAMVLSGGAVVSRAP
jgi:peptidoglycan/LPS O-acetylase OafA/YrhL